MGKPRSILGADNQHQAIIPLLDGAMPKFRFSETTLAYFRFVFAAITPLLFLGSVVGRINFNVWLLFVPLWSTFAYSVNAFPLWGGGGKDVADVTSAGWLWGHHTGQILVQLGAALTVIIWDLFVTFVLLRVLDLFMKLRAPDEALQVGDIAVHVEEAYPKETLVTGPRWD